MDTTKQLEIYRLEHKISQEKLAEMLGISFITVNRWINGHQRPSKIQAYHIRKLLEKRVK